MVDLSIVMWLLVCGLFTGGYPEDQDVLGTTKRDDPAGRPTPCRTALHIAVWSGSLHIVDLLLHCSDVNGAAWM